MEAKLVKSLITFLAARRQIQQPIRDRLFSIRIGPKPGRFLNLIIPIFCPHPVSLSRPWRPRKHRLVIRHFNRLAQQPQNPLRILQNISSVDHGRGFARSVPHPVKNLGLLLKTKVLRLRVVVGLSAEETAEALALTAGAVRVSQHRALAKLRHLLSTDAALTEQLV